MKQYDKLRQFYFPREIHLLAEYLEQTDIIPENQRDLRALNYVDEDWDESTQGIGIREGATYSSQDSERYGLANAVARICLAGVQEYLPQWAGVNSEGKTRFGRKVKSREQLPERILLARHVFTINWATNLVGTWPEAYYVTHLAGWNKFVVTASSDTDEIYGYEDFALGWFPSTNDPEQGVHEILLRYWSNLHSEFDQQRWEDLVELSSGNPDELADEVWGPKIETEEDKRKIKSYHCGPDHPIYSEGWTFAAQPDWSSFAEDEAEPSQTEKNDEDQ